jgi:nucleotide-binding universal stress UspA family protein
MKELSINFNFNLERRMKLRDHILVAIDFQDQSLAALEQSISLAKFIKGHIVLLHVIDTEYFLQKNFSLNREEIDRIKVEVSARLEQIAEKYSGYKGVDITTRIEEGKISERVIEVSNDIKARFIFIGKNGKKDNKHKNLGSNAFRILNQSKVPVISFAGKLKIK